MKISAIAGYLFTLLTAVLSQKHWIDNLLHVMTVASLNSVTIDVGCLDVNQPRQQKH